MVLASHPAVSSVKTETEPLGRSNSAPDDAPRLRRTGISTRLKAPWLTTRTGVAGVDSRRNRTRLARVTTSAKDSPPSGLALMDLSPHAWTVSG